MSARWFRFYDAALHDPKVQSLSGDLFKAWVNVLCLASTNDGKLPPINHVAFALRASEEHARSTLLALEEHGLLDRISNQHGSTLAPHGWEKRQFKSDTSTTRVKRFRKQVQAVSETPTETAPETDTDTDSSVANATGADAPPDFRKALFAEGLQSLVRQTGKTPTVARTLIGKLLKIGKDDARTVLQKIRQAEADGVAQPESWLMAALKATDWSNPVARQMRQSF